MPDQPFSEYSQQWKAPFIGRTIVGRVLFVCIALGLVPLLFYIALSWRTEAWIETQSILQALQQIDQQSTLSMRLWEKEKRKEITTLYKDKKLSTFQASGGRGGFFSKSLQDVMSHGFWPQKGEALSGGRSLCGVYVSEEAPQLIFVFFSSTEGVWLGERIPVEDWLQEVLFQEILSESAKALLLGPDDQILYPQAEAFQGGLQSIDFSFSLHDHLSWLFWPYTYQYVGLQETLPGSSCSLVVALPPPILGIFHVKKLFLKYIFFFFLGGGVGFFMIFLLLKRLKRPLQHFSHVMKQVAEGNLQSRYIEDSWGGEFNLLGKHFNEMLSQMLEHMAERQKVEMSQRLLSQELLLGRKIQKTLLPPGVMQFGDVAIASMFIPAKELSGDFYDVFQLNEDLLAICIGDGSDKGISACLYSLIVRAMLRHALRERPAEDYGEVLLRVNQLFCEDSQESGNFVTLGLGIFDKRNCHMTFFSMGHCPPIFITEKQTRQISVVQESAIGLERGEKVPAGVSLQLAPGDMFFLYTDGLSELDGSTGHFFNVEEMSKILKREKEKRPQEIVDALCQEALRIFPGALFSDDVTMLLLKVQESALRASSPVKDLD